MEIVAQAPSETLDTFYNRIAKLAKQCQFEPAEESYASLMLSSLVHPLSKLKRNFCKH